MSATETNQQFLLAARPVGEIKRSDFDLVDSPMPEAGPGQMLLKSQYLAVEPAMKGWMEARVDYVAPLQIGDVMRGHAVSEVVESNLEKFPD